MAHHRHIIGQSGTGKSTLMKRWIISAIHDGHSVCYIDPHGTDTDDLTNYIPHQYRTATTIFDPTQYPISWNPLVTDNIPLVASLFVSAVKNAWGYERVATPRMDSMVYNLLAALMEAKEGLFGLYLMLASDRYRTHVLKRVLDPVVRGYWHWYEALPDRQRIEWTESTFNKVQILMADERIRAVCGKRDRLNLPELVQDQILFLRLPQGEMGVERTALLGSIMLTQLHQVLLNRDETVPFHLFVDEAHTFAPGPLTEMLSGIRKKNVTVTIAHQYLSQLDTRLRASLKANAEAFVFRTSYEDADSFPELGGTVLQPYELPPFTYWHFGEGRPDLVPSEPLEFAPYEASRREVLSHIERNRVYPATKEIQKMLEKYG